jgi:hypothetical protein
MRVSRKGKRDPDKWLTVPAQRRAIERWVKDHGHRLVDLREDIDVSGRLDDRPNLEDIVGQVERGELGGLVVAKVDRFSRDLAYGAMVARGSSAPAARSSRPTTAWSSAEGARLRGQRRGALPVRAAAVDGRLLRPPRDAQLARHDRPPRLRARAPLGLRHALRLHESEGRRRAARGRRALGAVRRRGLRAPGERERLQHDRALARRPGRAHRARTAGPLTAGSRICCATASTSARRAPASACTQDAHPALSTRASSPPRSSRRAAPRRRKVVAEADAPVLSGLVRCWAAAP